MLPSQREIDHGILSLVYDSLIWLAILINKTILLVAVYKYNGILIGSCGFLSCIN